MEKIGLKEGRNEMETAREQKLQNGVGGILATTDRRDTAFNAHLSHYAVGLSASDSSSGHCAAAGQRIQIVAKKEQEDRTERDDLNLARLLTQI